MAGIASIILYGPDPSRGQMTLLVPTSMVLHVTNHCYEYNVHRVRWIVSFDGS
jgi:hypothetical protein